MNNLKFILSGGGTGGHIYPAIAIADELKSRYPEAEFLFVGAKDRMEMQKVPQAGYPIVGLWIRGIDRKITLQNMLFPVKLMSSLIKSAGIIRRFKPDVVIGTGGFAGGPILKMAERKSIPTLIQEQNSFAGVTNKWLAAGASVICVGHENMERYFPKEKIVLTGNPVRKDLLEIDSKKEEGLNKFKLDPDKKTLLVLGGSLGARTINETIAKQVDFLLNLGVQIIWQCGKLYHDRFSALNERENIQVHAFLDNMDLAYAAADFVISRSGATTVSELCLVGKPVVFIPSPNVAEDHQTKNAMSLVTKNAALMIKEADLDSEFESVFEKLINSEEKQKELSVNIKKMAKPNATADIVNEIEKLIK